MKSRKQARERGDGSSSVNISKSKVKAENIAGRNITITNESTKAQIEKALEPLDAAVGEHKEARQKLAQLKAEAAKGKKADDGVMAKLVKGVVGLVPSAVSAVASAFGTPILAAIAGPVTKFVLGEIQENKEGKEDKDDKDESE